MPPFISRKRKHSPSPSAEYPHEARSRVNSNSIVAHQPQSPTSESSSDSTSLSEVDNSEFEDVEQAFAPQSSTTAGKNAANNTEDGNSEDEDDEVDWEDAVGTDPLPTGPEPAGELNLTLDKKRRYDSSTKPPGAKKGPTKREKFIRNHTHCMHVQFLMFHNLIRNGWICDREIQQILLGHVPPGIEKEFEKWRVASGLDSQSSKAKNKSQVKSGTARLKSTKKEAPKNRDWGGNAERLEIGVPDMSRGDPLIRFLRLLGAWWKKRFTVTAPGLRKQGYKSVEDIEDLRKAFDKDPSDAEQFGERINGKKGFKKLAERCCGSRDVGAQLYVALLRGLGLDARLVCSLQPLGFGWSKVEDASKITTNRHSEIRPEVKLDPGGLSDSEGEAPAKIIEVEPPKTTGKSKIPRKRSLVSRGTGKRDTPLTLYSDSNDGSDTEQSSADTKPVASKIYDRDLAFPHYWAEVLSPISNKYIPVDPFVTSTVAGSPESLPAFEPRGAKAEKAKQGISYVVAFSSDGCAKDVTVRYLKNRSFPGKTKGFRFPTEKIPVYNSRGKVSKYENSDWFKTVMASYRRLHQKRTAADDVEDSTDLQPAERPNKEKSNALETLQGYKTSDTYILERHLKREEALLPSAKHVKTFLAGKGEKAQPEKVFLRKDVVACKTVESWHKEGREVKPGEQSLKLVPMRAVTLNRKRAIEQYEAEGERMMQGLYSRDQTDWIIPPPIVDGKIPRNEYGNMDCFVPSMVPEGAVHLPYRGLVKVCKKLEIDYAEAVTGFEFGNQRAVPVVQGVVVAEENQDIVLEAWEAAEEQRLKREKAKMSKQYLVLWRKFLVGLRIVERVRDEYGQEAEHQEKDEINPFTNRKILARGDKNQNNLSEPSHTEMEIDDEGGIGAGGGFLRDSHLTDDTGGGFLVNSFQPKDAIPKLNGATAEPIDPASSNDGESSGPLDHDIAKEPPEASQKTRVPSKKGRGTQKSRVRNSKTRIPPGKKNTRDNSHSESEMSVASSSVKTPMSRSRTNREAKSNGVKNQSNTASKSSRPKRRAARKSEQAVKSHYFEQSESSPETSASELG